MLTGQSSMATTTGYAICTNPKKVSFPLLGCYMLIAQKLLKLRTSRHDRTVPVNVSPLVYCIMLCWSCDHFVYFDANCENRSLMGEYFYCCDDPHMISYFSVMSVLLVMPFLLLNQQ